MFAFPFTAHEILEWSTLVVGLSLALAAMFAYDL
jgi:hypothetical protein